MLNKAELWKGLKDFDCPAIEIKKVFPLSLNRMDLFQNMMSSVPRPSSVTDEQTILVNRNSTSSLGAKLLRVRVNLSNGARILVPIDGESTVAQLVAESARRATALNLSYDTNEATLRSNDGSILFGEDSLKDVLDLAENPDLFLGRAETQASVLSSVGQICVQAVPRAYQCC